MKKLIEWIINKVSKDHVYLSGPMTGIPWLNKPLFAKEAKRLTRAGYKVINPGEFGDSIWILCLTRDLIFLLLFCNKIATLPDWRKSKGACLESHVGKKLDMPIHTVRYWLKRGK